MSQCFLNDQIVEQDQATLSISDSGFLYGMGLFETLRAASGRIFALSDHLDRLLSSAGKLAIPCPFDKPWFESALHRVLQANELTDARIRLTLSPGSIRQNDSPQPTVLITTTAFQAYPREYYDKGIRVILSDYRQNPADPTTGHKTTSYFSRLFALQAAHRKNATEALWFTTDNYLAEGCISNVFLVKNSAIQTPSLDTPVLPGIARTHLCRLAAGESISLSESHLTIKELLSADEVFLSNVIMGVMPIVGIEAHTVGEGKVGPVTKKFMEAFDRLVASEPAQGDRP
jgi:branched-chain amino acid aminotransferase